MINKKTSLLLLSPLLLTTPLLLSSCATTSQYGVAATIKFSTTPTNSGSGSTTKETGSGSGGEATTTPEIDFSNFAYNWTNQKLYKDRKEVKLDDYKEFSLMLSLGINPEISLFSNLITGSHVGFSSSEIENPLFGSYSENGNNNLLKEFLYASANTLNQGRSGEIRLNIAEIDIKASSNFIPNDNDKLKVTDVIEYSNSQKENTKKYKVSTLQFQNESKLSFSFTMKYYNSGDSNPFKEPVTIDKVNSYLGPNGQLWNGTKATKDSFTLSSKLEVNINPIYSVNSDKVIEYDKTNGVTDTNSGNGDSSSSIATTTQPNNEMTYKNIKDKVTLVGASVQYSYKTTNNSSGGGSGDGTTGYENDFAKALAESLKPKEEAQKPSTKTGEENNDAPKVVERKLENGSTLTTWLNKANEFSKVTTNQDVINYRNTLSKGFQKTITLDASNPSTSK